MDIAVFYISSSRSSSWDPLDSHPPGIAVYTKSGLIGEQYIGSFLWCDPELTANELFCETSMSLVVLNTYDFKQCLRTVFRHVTIHEAVIALKNVYGLNSSDNIKLAAIDKVVTLKRPLPGRDTRCSF
ncbi:hypothetical protein TNCV_1670041 [Trichonephila clavipes]|nr:hypothetical protein TNCV_1670041 [Trichonephila clavipes]